MVDLIAIGNWVAAHTLEVIIILLVIVIIKGLALYRAARRGSVIWFWVIFLVNTLGILPLLYLIFSRSESNIGGDI